MISDKERVKQLEAEKIEMCDRIEKLGKLNEQMYTMYMEQNRDLKMLQKEAIVNRIK
jgi:hypothetical protein